MINILVTGSNGQVGSEIKGLSSEYNYNFLFTDRDSLDITDKKKIEELVDENNTNVIINCAAYTAVDKAEEEREIAELINYKAVKYLAEISKEKNIKLIHISTDYVFDGRNFKPYNEEDIPNPTTIYGQSKLYGEESIIKINPMNSIIIRTSWVYSIYGNNFVKTMLKLGKDRDELGVIFDQVGTPTYAKDLAKTIIDIIPQIENKSVEIYHYSNEGAISWYDFSKEIMKLSKIECQINPIETKDYPTLAVRPYYSVLNKLKIKNKYSIKIPYWKDSLVICLNNLGERK